MTVLLLAAVLVLVGTVAVRTAGRGVFMNSHGVQVRTITRTRTLLWTAVAGIESRQTQPVGPRLAYETIWIIPVTGSPIATPIRRTVWAADTASERGMGSDPVSLSDRAYDRVLHTLRKRRREVVASFPPDALRPRRGTVMVWSTVARPRIARNAGIAWHWRGHDIGVREEIWGGLGLLGVASLATVAWSVAVGRSPPEDLGLIGLIAVWIGGSWRFWSLGVYPGRDGVRIRNLFRTRTLRWMDVLSIESRPSARRRGEAIWVVPSYGAPVETAVLLDPRDSGGRIPVLAPGRVVLRRRRYENLLRSLQDERAHWLTVPHWRGTQRPRPARPV